LYESLWDLCVVGIILAVEHRYRLRKGSLLLLYAAAYTFGPVLRFVTGTWYTAPALALRIAGRRQPPLRWSF